MQCIKFYSSSQYNKVVTVPYLSDLDRIVLLAIRVLAKFITYQLFIIYNRDMTIMTVNHVEHDVIFRVAM